MSNLHNYGLARFHQKSGKIDTVLTAIGQGLIKLWGLQNTPKTKACVIVDVDERRVVMECVGTADGFPEIHEKPEDFEFDLPDGLFDVFEEEVAKRAAERAK